MTGEANTMLTKDQIQAHLSASLVDMFEIDPANIQPDARLYEDLDIDSLDAVDLVIQLRDFTGAKVRPEQFKEVRTVGDIVNVVYDLLQQPQTA